MLHAARATAGAPLDSGTRAFMEPRFRHDFSRVRLHADREADMAAGALGARAFTMGEHVFLGAGLRGPAAQHVLAHELAHVVQQRAGAVAGQPQPGGYLLGEAGDRFEIAAERGAAAAMAAQAGAAGFASAPPAAAGRAGAPPVVQRFLAGEDGHGGVEEEALQEAGLSKQESKDAYYGNWLRDFSQLMDKESPTDPGALDLIRLLTTSEFNRDVGNADLGRYLPSEHLDNPLGGKTAEDPDPAFSQAERDQRLKNLNAEQQAWVMKERSANFQADIARRSEKSGLPAYIETGKAHARAEIERAAQLGRTPDGLRALGNGLHAVEDYFAHSNFVEVALAQLGPAHEGRIAQDSWVADATSHYPGLRDPSQIPGPDGKTVDNRGRPRILTGTSAEGSGDKVGKWEVIKTEFATHQFLKAPVLAAVRRPWQTFKTLGRLALGAVGGLTGAVVGGAAGLFGGAAKGAAAGWRSGRHWWSKPLAAIGGLVTGAGKGFVSGAKSGWGLGKKAGGALGEILAPVIGPLLAVAATLLFAVAEFSAPIAGSVRAFAGWRIKRDAPKTIGENPGKLPTHSQIAKDDPDHPLHNAAARLARVADRAIARTMIDVWAHKVPVTEAQNLVDVYVAHPQDGNWWKADLLAAIAAHGAATQHDPLLRIRGYWEMHGH